MILISRTQRMPISRMTMIILLHHHIRQNYFDGSNLIKDQKYFPIIPKNII